MKNKTLKKTLLISTGLLAAGGICIGIGIAMGGSPVFYLDNEGIHLKETTACPETVQDYAGQKQLAAQSQLKGRSGIPETLRRSSYRTHTRPV